LPVFDGMDQREEAFFRAVLLVLADLHRGVGKAASLLAELQRQLDFLFTRRVQLVASKIQPR
jgi:hypothetical protein